MKMYIVDAMWKGKKERKHYVKTAIIMAKTEKQALLKFKTNIFCTDEMKIYIRECNDEIYICELKRTY